MLRYGSGLKARNCRKLSVGRSLRCRCCLSYKVRGCALIAAGRDFLLSAKDPVRQLITTSGEVFLFLDNRFFLSAIFKDERISSSGKMIPNQNNTFGIFARYFEKAARSWKCATAVNESTFYVL